MPFIDFAVLKDYNVPILGNRDAAHENQDKASGAALLLICMLPHYFKSTGRVSLISGVLNAYTYIGSAASTYLTPLITRDRSWNVTVLSWLLAAALGTVLCLLCIPTWKKRSIS